MEPTTCRLASRDREHVLVLLVHGDRTHAAESRRSRRYWGQGGVLGVLARGGGATVNILQFHTLSQFLNNIITYHTKESVFIKLNDKLRNSAFLVQLQIQFRVRKRGFIECTVLTKFHQIGLILIHKKSVSRIFIEVCSWNRTKILLGASHFYSGCFKAKS